MGTKIVEKKKYDARMDSFALVIFFTVGFIIFLLMYTKRNIEQDAESMIFFIIGSLFMVAGTYDVIQADGTSKNGLYLWAMIWFMGASLIVLAYGDELSIVVATMICVIWRWLLYICGVKLLFSGYYPRLKERTIWVLFILGGFIISPLYIIPELFLLYHCFKHKGDLQAFVNRKLFYTGIILLCMDLILYAVFTAENLVTGELTLNRPMGIAYEVFFIFLMVFFTAMYRNILKKKDENFIGDNRFLFICLTGNFVLVILLFQYGLTAIQCLIAVLMGICFILLYKFIEIFFKTEKWIKRRNFVIMQFERERQRERESAEFLHDEVLQGLYAAKLLVRSSGESVDAANEVERILGELQVRIRREIEVSGINLEKALSFKENISIMLSGLEKRFSGKEMVISLFCRDNLIVHEPLDLRFYYFIKELTTNAFKHGGNKCEISLWQNGGKIRLEVSDDGDIIEENEEELLSKGFGLVSMKEQVLTLGGTFEIRKNPAGGLWIMIEMRGN